MNSLNLYPDLNSSFPENQHLMFHFGAALSPQPSGFAPLLFAGRFGEGIELLPKAGFKAVEISLRRSGDLNLHWFEDRLAALGLVVSAFATGRICLEDSLCLSDPNPLVREQLTERLNEIIQLAAHFGASVIIGGVRGKLYGNEAHKTDQYVAAVETLGNLANIAGDSGINLYLEPINRYETNFINSVEQGIELIESIGHSSVKLLLDTFHMNIEEVDPCSAIHAAEKHLGYVHFADSNRQAPGRGHINFNAILEALTSIGYRGYITAEILPIPDDAQALLNAGQFLNSLVYEK
jgi:sugar phosphate isomerase/epimerase